MSAVDCTELGGATMSAGPDRAPSTSPSLPDGAAIFDYFHGAHAHGALHAHAPPDVVLEIVLGIRAASASGQMFRASAVPRRTGIR